MKTFADLKIGDTVYKVNGLNLTHSKIIELSLNKSVIAENFRTEESIRLPGTEDSKRAI